MAITSTYISATSFSVTGDYTDVFSIGRAVRGDNGVDGYSYGAISTSSYNPNITTISLNTVSGSLTTNLVTTLVGITDVETGSLPDHDHSAAGQGGEIGGVVSHNNLSGLQGGAANDYYHLTSAQETELTDGSETSLHIHDGRYYTESEVDTLIASASGTTDHSELDQLDYASAGHTGFQPAGDYYTESEVDTISGSLQTNIDGKSDTSHGHTASDVSDFSEATDDRVNNLLVAGDNIELTYDDGANTLTISGGAGGGTTNHSELNELDYTSAGHTGFSPTSHNHTESNITDLDKYTVSEVDTISGSLSSEIDSDISTHTSNADAHHAESHTVASHSDTTATGAELETLTDGSDADALHNHPTDVIDSDWDQNGFENRTDSTITWTDSSPDYTLSIQPTVTSFNYWIAGVKYTSTGDTTQIDNTKEGIHTIYYDGSTLTSLANPTASNISDLIRNKALVSIVYWDVSASAAIYVGEERHGKNMAPSTHNYLHFTEGLKYLSGLGLNTMGVDGTGDDNTNAQFGISAGSVADEDVYLTISPVTSTSGLPIYYMLGVNAEWQKYTNIGYSARTFDGTSSTRLACNEYTGGAWQLTEVTNLDFVLYHIFATTEKDNPIISIMGQNDYTTLNQARTGALTEIRSLVLDDVLFPEIKPVATVIFQTSTGYSNDIKSRIRSTDDGDDYIDWRSETISRVEFSTSDHNALSGLQGGAANDYYHLTSAQETELTDGSETSLHIHDGRYYTESEVDTISGSLSTEIDSDISTHTSNADAHHDESHTVVSHSDTTATGAELDTLTGGGDTTLHDHDGISENTSARHDESHTITSHSDIVDATGAQIEELTGGGDTTLHDHDGISENTGARHTRSHTMISTTDHTAGNWKLFASNGSGQITEIIHGTDTYVLTSNGAAVAPTWQASAGGGLSNIVEDTTPQLGGDLDLNEYKLSLEPAPASNLGASGMIATMTVDANSTGVGAALHLDTDGNFIECDADVAALLPCSALALETGTGAKKVLFYGFIRNDAWAWSPGGMLFVSTTTGALTHTKPSGTGDQVQVVGIATHADRIFFNPNYVIATVA